MTESEAKTKWCPMVRYSVTHDERPNEPAANRWTSGNNIHKTNCIGSACSMWRAETESQHVDLVGNWNGKVEKLMEAGWRTFTLDPTDPSATVKRNTKHGYCGLAGKP